jgi:large subunit ribosomal protein L17
MRHKLGYRKLNRTSEHRKALFKNMLNSLIKYEQITTTLPKAKELKPQIDKAITLGKKNNLHSKKSLYSKLQDKFSVNKLSKILSTRYEKRKGGYSRVVRAGFRYGDQAPMAIIELIDRDIKAKKVDIKKKTSEPKKVESSDKQEQAPIKKDKEKK